MSNKNTDETHDRFWSRMAELFGRKWYEEYGSDIPVSWRELVDKYTPRQLKAGLDILRQRTWQYGLPTQPDVAACIEQAVQRAKNLANDPNELRRGFWRSCIVTEVARALGYNAETLEPVVIANKDSLGRAMRDLLDELDDSEQRTGQRTKGHDDAMRVGCQRIAIAYNRLQAAKALT